jgi:hypothetical protein
MQTVHPAYKIERHASCSVQYTLHLGTLFWSSAAQQAIEEASSIIV